jgi:Zn finger protein HypA/HybF involved in hydrogenase expression
MHEYGIVDQLIGEFLKTPQARRLNSVRLVRLSYGPGLTAASLRQAFLVQSAGTPLSRTRVELEPKPIVIACPCGARLSPYPEAAAGHEHAHGHSHDHDHDHDHDHGLPYLSCEKCGAVHAIPHFNTLELTHAE